MISVISGTNRSGSYSLKVAEHYTQVLENKGAECQLLDLATMPRDFAFSELYGARSEEFAQIIEKFIESVDKFVFVMPEYNGGFPGFLKLFIDAVPPKAFHDKMAGLVGVSAGHAGALRPMDQFTNVLNYLKVDVISAKPKLSGVEKLFDDVGVLVNERAVKGLEDHAEKMIRS